MACKAIQLDFYVDDLLTGAKTYADALDLRDKIIEITQSGGFKLRKWASNDERLVRELSNNMSQQNVQLDSGKDIKALGIHWNPKSDMIFYSVNIDLGEKSVTKRIIVSETAKLFDPVGKLSPIIILFKTLIQKLWLLHLGWDEIERANGHFYLVEGLSHAIITVKKFFDSAEHNYRELHFIANIRLWRCQRRCIWCMFISEIS